MGLPVLKKAKLISHVGLSSEVAFPIQEISVLLQEQSVDFVPNELNNEPVILVDDTSSVMLKSQPDEESGQED